MTVSPTANHLPELGVHEARRSKVGLALPPGPARVQSGRLFVPRGTGRFCVVWVRLELAAGVKRHGW